jgi:hypothetical protein
MTKRILSAAALATALFFTFAPSSRAGDITSTIGLFDETPDFSGNYPLPAVNLGDFTFSLPNGFIVAGATISGTFGNNDVPGTTNITADSDYFVDGTGIEVATCDTPNIASTFTPTLACDSGSMTGAPTPWSYTFTAAQLTILAPLFAAGSVDFNVVQNFYGAVETGPITLDIAPAPEPATIFVVSLGIAGIALLRRRTV